MIAWSTTTVVRGLRKALEQFPIGEFLKQRHRLCHHPSVSGTDFPAASFSATSNHPPCYGPCHANTPGFRPLQHQPNTCIVHQLMLCSVPGDKVTNPNHAHHFRHGRLEKKATASCFLLSTFCIPCGTREPTGVYRPERSGKKILCFVR